ncbi:MAG: hypothetical protein R2745_17015 [Vicinamibacterales bacterium]
MTTETYRTALDAAITEYEALGQQRRDIDTRLTQLAQTIGTLSRLMGLTPTVPLGLTDACRLVLRGGVPMTPTEVRDRLVAIGVDLTIYTSELSAIHTVLKRLNESGEIRIVPRPNGRPAYLWQAPPTAVAISPEIAAHVRASGTFHTRPARKPKTDARARKKRPR